MSEKPTIRILTEDVLTLTEARNEIEAIIGRRPDVSTITRWIHKGVGGVKLEAVRFGRQILVSRQALTRFVEERTANSIGKPESSNQENPPT